MTGSVFQKEQSFAVFVQLDFKDQHVNNEQGPIAILTPVCTVDPVLI